MNGNIIEVRNPATLEKIAELPVAAKAAVAEAVGRGRQAQAMWQKRSLDERAKELLRFRDLLIDQQEKIVDILISETGRPRAEAYGSELFYLYDAIGFWAKNAQKYLKPERLRPHLIKGKKVFSTYSPMGVIGIIGPWNFPLILTLGEALPALMAGNSVVIKPSELTPLSLLFVAELAGKADFPPHLIQVVLGFGETGESLVDHADMISFTGSVETGKKVLRRAAERLIPVTLELGGKDPMIVLRDADLERAANACVWGGLMNCGQVCTSVERVYVEEPVYDDFVKRVVAKVGKLRQGKGDGELGSMTSEDQLRKVEAQVQEAVARGAKLLTGGRRSPAITGLSYEPTVLVDVDHTMALMREETFGPVIPIMKVKDREEALRLANDSPYGLDGSVFTKSREAGRTVVEQMQAGAVCVNDCLVNFVIPEAPMGGVKESGLGRRHGAEGIRKYCRQKTVVIDRLGLKKEFFWFPNTKTKSFLLRRGLRLLFRSGWKKKLLGR